MPSYSILTVEACTKWPILCRYFSNEGEFDILIQISLKLVPNGPIHNTLALVRVVALVVVIIWTSVDTNPWSFMASLYLNMLGVMSWNTLYALTHLGRVRKLTSIGLDYYYLNQCWNIVNSNLRNKLQWNHQLNSYIFNQENVFENIVWKMAANFVSAPIC